MTIHLDPLPELLSQEQIDTFNNEGFLILRSFYDQERELTPIQFGIYSVIEILVRKYGLPISQEPFHPDAFDSGYQQLIAHDRKIGGEVYDAVKQIPAFMRLVADEKHHTIFSQLRDTNMPGIAAGGYGIRIDNPLEEKFRADWHQEYPAQLRSLDGLVFWSPLVAVSNALGPVRFCVGSHKDGVVPVLTKDPENPGKQGAYALILKDKEERIARYEQVAPLTKPGDLIISDFLVLHSSGYNRGERSRWSMQFRYFNFLEPMGMRIGWRGSFAAGVDFRQIHPELVADETN